MAVAVAVAAGIHRVNVFITLWVQPRACQWLRHERSARCLTPAPMAPPARAQGQIDSGSSAVPAGNASAACAVEPPFPFAETVMPVRSQRVALPAVSGEPLARYKPLQGGGELVRGVVSAWCRWPASPPPRAPAARCRSARSSSSTLSASSRWQARSGSPRWPSATPISRGGEGIPADRGRQFSLVAPGSSPRRPLHRSRPRRRRSRPARCGRPVAGVHRPRRAVAAPARGSSTARWRPPDGPC